MNGIQRLGRDTLDRIEGIGASGIMLARSVVGIPALSGFGLFSHQMYRVGVLSLLIISLILALIGMAAVWYLFFRT